MSDNGLKNHGEGDPEAARRYDRATLDFVASGKVDAAAEAARPADPREATELLAAGPAPGTDPA